MFVACRAKANALVDAIFTRLAQAYYRTRNKNYAYQSIKLAKLRSLFTLYYYIRVVEQSKEHVQKDSYSLLPKVAVNDLIRNGLSDRDREVLVLVTGNKGQVGPLAMGFAPITFVQLKQRMNRDILECARLLGPRISEVRAE